MIPDVACEVSSEKANPSVKASGWERAGATWRFPDGESLRDQLDRVSASVSDVRSTGPLPALVVCHGGSIRVMLCQADPRGLDAFHEFETPNAGLFDL